MTRRHATRIDRVAQPSYSALAFEIGDFLEKRHTLLRTLTDVATRPWRTPLSRAAGPGPSCARDYGKDQCRAVSRKTVKLYYIRPSAVKSQN